MPPGFEARDGKERYQGRVQKRDKEKAGLVDAVLYTGCLGMEIRLEVECIVHSLIHEYRQSELVPVLLPLIM